jgi:hypothetical protein
MKSSQVHGRGDVIQVDRIPYISSKVSAGQILHHGGALFQDGKPVDKMEGPVVTRNVG